MPTPAEMRPETGAAECGMERCAECDRPLSVQGHVIEFQGKKFCGPECRFDWTIRNGKTTPWSSDAPYPLVSKGGSTPADSDGAQSHVASFESLQDGERRATAP